MHVYSDPSRESDAYALPDVEIFYVHAMPRRAYDRTYAADLCEACEGAGCEDCPAPGWYWQTCLPGCLPDSDAFGPFETIEEATADAQSID
jgi:hypothetical protein